MWYRFIDCPLTPNHSRRWYLRLARCSSEITAQYIVVLCSLLWFLLYCACKNWPEGAPAPKKTDCEGVKKIRFCQHVLSAIKANLNTTNFWRVYWLVGLLAAADCVEPRLDSDVVLEPRPGQPCPASLPRLSRKPSGPRATFEFLYQSGTLSFWRERCTRSWCSDMTRSPAPPFCSSFSGGCNANKTSTYSVMHSEHALVIERKIILVAKSERAGRMVGTKGFYGGVVGNFLFRSFQSLAQRYCMLWHTSVMINTNHNPGLAK